MSLVISKLDLGHFEELGKKANSLYVRKSIVLRNEDERQWC
jgi:hypothetical protein